MQSEMNAVLLDNVCKSFGQVHAVDNLSVRVSVGSVYGFLGPNGAGKTTTIRMIMNIIRPDSGRIEILGNGQIEQVKTRIGYMPEERGLYRKMTVRKVLAYFGAIKGLDTKELTHRVPHWLQRVDLADWADKKVEELSRGMHQKLQFAVTVINEPELVILDEPFSGLDPLNQDLIKNIILEMRNEGKTVIFSTHVMHEAEQLCDFILLINKGKPILDDTLDNVRSRQSAHTVSVELEGDTAFVENLPMVTAVKSEGKRLDVTLADADTQQFLQALLQRAKVRAFEVKVPSLHEIFVNLVGASDAEDS
ncbi:MAG TPA: ATP-binding cassette domain-containing protein [Sedimentisphaerales bacterium]|nr:ATP-binding cassette domain-containing protein [Sedimentisphaerales bacterium]